MINLFLIALIACGSEEETDTSKEANTEELQVTEEQEESSEEVPVEEGTEEQSIYTSENENGLTG